MNGIPVSEKWNERNRSVSSTRSKQARHARTFCFVHRLTLRSKQCQVQICMATLVGDMDEDIALVVVGPWELQHPRRRHLSSLRAKTNRQLTKITSLYPISLCALSFLRHCRRQHEERGGGEEAAASRKTRSRRALDTKSLITKSR
jgi:hypothetical protein